MKLPKTYLGFPIQEDSQEDGLPPRSRSRGIALIIAIMIISIMMMFASDFMVSSSVDLTLAASERDNIKAEFVAKSGANWALWLNLFDYGLELQLSSINDPTMKQAKSAIGPLWNKLNDVFMFDTPIDLTQMDTFAKLFGMSATMDSATIEMFQALGGELGIGVVDEGGKINLNVCFQSASACKTIMAQLQSLMTCTDVEKEYIKQTNIKPEEITARIQDWIDQNPAAEPASGSSSEDDVYQKRTPPHKAKNSPLDTLDELKVVEGWNDELHGYFSDYLTIFPFTFSQDKDKSLFKLNVNAMNSDVLKCFFSRELSSPEARENFVKKLKESQEAGSSLANSEAEIQTLLKEVMNYQGDPAEKGKETDKSTWFSSQSRAYKIRAKGVVGDQTRVVEFLMERQAAVQRKGTTGTPPWRLDGYKIR